MSTYPVWSGFDQTSSNLSPLEKRENSSNQYHLKKLESLKLCRIRHITDIFHSKCPTVCVLVSFEVDPRHVLSCKEPCSFPGSWIVTPFLLCSIHRSIYTDTHYSVRECCCCYPRHRQLFSHIAAVWNHYLLSTSADSVM